MLECFKTVYKMKTTIFFIIFFSRTLLASYTTSKLQKLLHISPNLLYIGFNGTDVYISLMHD